MLSFFESFFESLALPSPPVPPLAARMARWALSSPSSCWILSSMAAWTSSDISSGLGLAPSTFVAAVLFRTLVSATPALLPRASASAPARAPSGFAVQSPQLRREGLVAADGTSVGIPRLGDGGLVGRAAGVTDGVRSVSSGRASSGLVVAASHLGYDGGGGTPPAPSEAPPPGRRRERRRRRRPGPPAMLGVQFLELPELSPQRLADVGLDPMVRA